MSENGWIKIYRKILDKGWYKDSHYCHLWMHLILRANHKPNEWLYKGKLMQIERGQIIASRKSLSSETGIEQSKIERILSCFESEQQIKQQNLYINRLITIINYNQYQNNDQDNEQRVNSERTASEQRVNTNKNVKNIKNVKNKESIAPFSDENEALYDFFISTYPEHQQRYIPKTDRQIYEWKRCFDLCNRMNKYSFYQLADIISFFRNDDFWQEQFLTPLKLKKKNKEGILYIDFFWSKLEKEGFYDGSDEKLSPLEYINKLKEDFNG